MRVPIRRTVGSTVAYGAACRISYGFGYRFYLPVLRVRRLGHIYRSDSGDDGRFVGVSAYVTFALVRIGGRMSSPKNLHRTSVTNVRLLLQGRIYEQILRRCGLSIPAVLFQADIRMRRKSGRIIGKRKRRRKQKKRIYNHAPSK